MAQYRLMKWNVFILARGRSPQRYLGDVEGRSADEAKVQAVQLYDLSERDQRRLGVLRVTT